MACPRLKSAVVSVGSMPVQDEPPTRGEEIGVCGTDERSYGLPKVQPFVAQQRPRDVHVPGHERCADVRASGPGVVLAALAESLGHAHRRGDVLVGLRVRIDVEETVQLPVRKAFDGVLLPTHAGRIRRCRTPRAKAPFTTTGQPGRSRRRTRRDLLD